MVWALFWSIYLAVMYGNMLTHGSNYHEGYVGLFVMRSVWLTLQLKAYGLLGHAIHRSHQLKGCIGCLGKLACLITYIAIIFNWIWSIVWLFANLEPNTVWTFNWIFYCGLQAGQCFSILMLLHIACKPPGMRDPNSDNGVGGTTVIVETQNQQQYQPPQPQYQQQPYP